MKTNPIISIVMPMYGVEKYISKAINSVLDQTFQEWELLIVNDGSTDNSRAIASTFAEQDKRIKILDKENGGLSDARNYGLKNATGDFVHFFDSDDWIEPDYYSKLLSSVGDYDLVICGYFVDTENRSSIRSCYSGELNEITGESLNHIVGFYLNFAWNKLFRTAFILDNTLYYEKGLYRIEDSEFMMRYLNCNPKVKFVEYVGYHYMIRNTCSLSTTFDDNTIGLTVRSISIHKKIFSLLCKNDAVVKYAMGEMTVSAIKSVLYSIARNVPVSSITQHKNLINKIIMNDDIFSSCYDYVPLRVYDRLVVSLIRRQEWFFLFLISQLKKIIS